MCHVSLEVLSIMKIAKHVATKFGETQINIKAILLQIVFFSLSAIFLLAANIICYQDFTDSFKDAARWSWFLSIQILLTFILFLLKERYKAAKAIFSAATLLLKKIYIVMEIIKKSREKATFIIIVSCSTCLVFLLKWLFKN